MCLYDGATAQQPPLQDLLALGSVMCSRGQRAAPASKRGRQPTCSQSKLTRLLYPSMSGGSCTSLIACVNPTAPSRGESISTLMYAARVKTCLQQGVSCMAGFGLEDGALADKVVEMLKADRGGRRMVEQPAEVLAGLE